MTNPTTPHAARADHDTHRPDDASAPSPTGRACPLWCVSQHAAHAGEEDWLHTSAPVTVADGMAAQLCMSIHPTTGDEDGPYVLVGTSELTLAETALLGASLLRLADAGAGVSVR